MLDHTGAQVLTNWVLLIAVEQNSESFLPRKFIAGKPCGWVERIILSRIEIGGGDVALGEPYVDSGPEADIDIAWKH